MTGVYSAPRCVLRLSIVFLARRVVFSPRGLAPPVGARVVCLVLGGHVVLETAVEPRFVSRAACGMLKGSHILLFVRWDIIVGRVARCFCFTGIGYLQYRNRSTGAFSLLFLMFFGTNYHWNGAPPPSVPLMDGSMLYALGGRDMSGTM